MPPRILIAGFQHETNSFATTRAGLPEFEMADSWPPLLRGSDVIPGTRGMNLPIAGFIAAARAEALLIPALWCAAEPSGPVTTDAFETILDEILAVARQNGPLDGIYLDLHGAMITEDHDDGEAEILRRLRASVGPDLPLTISLDMHANLSDAMVRQATAITMFRTYPHLDMADAGARAWVALKSQMQGARPAKALRKLPFLIPLHAQFTGAEPAKSLYGQVEGETQGPTRWAEFAVGFTAGDTLMTGPAILTHAPDQRTADQMADRLLDAACSAETAFDQPLPSAKEAVCEALALPLSPPVVIADVQDNPGGGGTSDTIGLLRALIDAQAKGALLGVMHDPEAAATAHRAGVGATISLGLGGRSGLPGEAPVHGSYRVEALSDGEVVYEGAMYGGATAQIGPTALLKTTANGADIDILVSSVRNQCLDLAYFRHIGVRPEDARIIVVKSTVHFRDAFALIAQAILPAQAPGHLSCVPNKVHYQKLQPGLRLGPNGPPFRPIPKS